MNRVLLIFSHLGVGVLGVILGVYLFPLVTQPKSPSQSEVNALAAQAVYTGHFERTRQDSDFLHWGEGTFTITKNDFVFNGELSPGPDYLLYLSPKFVETEADFMKLKKEMVSIGSVKTFERFILPLPDDLNVSRYNTAIVWCESFGEFISSGRYQ